MTLRIDPALPKVKPVLPLASLDDGLVLNLSLNQQSYDSATKIFTDTSPFHNDGTSYNDATFTTNKMGQSNRAVSFNGTNDYVNCGNDASLDITDAITIEAWINSNALSNDVNWRGIIQKQNGSAQLGGGGNGYVLYYRLGKVRAYIKKDSSSSEISASVVKDVWHHIVMTYDNTTLSLYVDGVVSSNNSPDNLGDSGTSSLYIGNSTGYSSLFNGTIDEVRVYNRALSADEITSLYEMYRSKFLI